VSQSNQILMSRRNILPSSSYNPRRIQDLITLEKDCKMLFQNDAMSYPRRTESSASPVQKLQNSYCNLFNSTNTAVIKFRFHIQFLALTQTTVTYIHIDSLSVALSVNIYYFNHYKTTN